MATREIRRGGVLGTHNALATVMAAALMLVLSAAAQAATITVNSLADTGAPGICVLRDAITAANTKAATNGCTAGTGSDTIDFSVTGTITLGSTLPKITDRLLTLNGPTAPGITIDGGGKVRVMAVASRAELNLNMLTIAHGNVYAGDGGGLNNRGTLTITHSTVARNRVAFFGNFSGGNGGAIENSGTLTIAYSRFSDNSAGNGLNNTGNGGAIDNLGTLTIVHSTFSGNSTGGGGYGGAISSGGTLTITQSVFSANGAGHDGGGGAIVCGGTVTISNSSFSQNTADLFGGGIYNGGSLTVLNSTFSGNSAADFNISAGGGIENFGSTASAVILNDTFSENSAFAVSGGGIDNDGGRMTVTNSTFAGNGAPFGGNINVGASTPTSVKNTILAASSEGGNCSGTITDAGYNISDDSTCNFSATGSRNNTDPMLDPAGLASNGGPTQTIALLSGSPAIDAIPLADCIDQASPPNPIINDQRLFPRPDDDETNCDIGAYEFQDTAFIPFSHLSGILKIDPDAGVFDLAGGLTVGAGGSFDPTTQPAAFSLGSYAIRLPVGSFVKSPSGYVYQKTVNGIFLCIYLEFTSTPGSYQLLANRIGGSLTATTSPVPVTLIIGQNGGSTLMNATFN